VNWLIVCAIIATFVVAWAAAAWMRRVALQHRLLDVPNSRSSHSVPVPTGGGVAIAGAATLGLVVLFAIGEADWRLTLTLLCGGLSIALVGFLDDRQSVRPRIRFAIHVIAALLGVYLLGGVPPLQVGASNFFELGWLGHVLGVFAIVWTLNLFNFMDGIDGMATSEAAFVAIGGAAIEIAAGRSATVALAAMVVGASSLGFLVWNWPPAKMFMGDVGSGYLGFVMAVLALASARDNSVMIFVWLILGGVFFVDATVTLIRRLLRRERVYQAHRTHAYQWLARHWQSHKKVTLLVWALNLGWLLPMAWLCQFHPPYAVAITLLALAPLVVLALLAGAGRPEIRDRGLRETNKDG
jgi:Fuc2NAc and GlcNAc transferase